jgi:hypothetical protein
MILRVLMRSCVAAYFLKKSQPYVTLLKGVEYATRVKSYNPLLWMVARIV